MLARRFMYVVMVGLALLLAACGAPNVGSDRDMLERTINVNGVGVAYGAPDVATAHIGIEVRNADAQQAVKLATERATDIVDALKTLGVADEDIQTANYSIFPSQEYDREGNLGEMVYFVNNTLQVTFRDLDVIGEALTAAVEAGANSVSNIVFSVSDPAGLMAEARELAVADAMARATQLAESTGASLGEVQFISEYSYGPVPFSSKMPVMFGGDMGMGGGGVPVPVESGQNSVQVEVNITWLLE